MLLRQVDRAQAWKMAGVWFPKERHQTFAIVTTALAELVLTRARR